MKNKKFILPGILVTVFMIAAIYGSGQVFAEDSSAYPSIVQRIANRFSLKESDVNEVFNQQRMEMWENRKQFFSDKLDQAVKDGKITENQKQKILDKRDELQANREVERKEHRDEMQNWMKENGINPEVFDQYFGFGDFGNHRFNHMKMMN